MTHYNHDMMHCVQDQCKKKDQCYRYWLGQEIKNQDLQYAGYYLQEKPVIEGCSYFVNKYYFE